MSYKHVEYWNGHRIVKEIRQIPPTIIVDETEKIPIISDIHEQGDGVDTNTILEGTSVIAHEAQD